MGIKLYTNGVIHTLEAEKPVVQAMAVKDGRILDLGEHADMLLQWGRPGTEIVDLCGQMATPGLIDSHMHLSGLALFLLSLDLTGVASKAELLAQVRERAAATPPGEWLIGRGWDEHLFADGGMPDLAELNEAAPHCPVYLGRVCCHAALVNQAALDRTGLTPETALPQGGMVVLDPDTARPNGLLREAAAEFVAERIPPRSSRELKEAVRQALQVVLEAGLTAIHTDDTRYLGGFAQTWQILSELAREERLRPRIHELIDFTYLEEMVERRMLTGYGDEFLRVGALKVFADGVLSGRTALLSAPYSDAPGRLGEAIHSSDELRDMVRKARSHGLPLAVHVIGDQALQNVLDALDRFPAAAYRDRLIHAVVLRPDLVRRLRQPSRVADIQPRFVPGDFPWVMERLGAQRTGLSYAWKTLLAAGVACAGGSDAPVEPVQPLLGLHAAITRKKPGSRGEGWNPAECLSLDEALRLFTLGGAAAVNEEHFKGTLTRGKAADLTVYSRDLYACEPDELLDVRIERTIVNGEICYERNG